jgi:hypothetical protein
VVVVIVDEAHSFFHERKGTSPEVKAHNAVVAELSRLVEELIRKGRNVAIQVMLLTQRATGDAIPTRIRDNCQVAISFATRTLDGAVAALGEEIRQPPTPPRSCSTIADAGARRRRRTGPGCVGESLRLVLTGPSGEDGQGEGSDADAKGQQRRNGVAGMGGPLARWPASVPKPLAAQGRGQQELAAGDEQRNGVLHALMLSGSPTRVLSAWSGGGP